MPSTLSPRETEILALVADGLTSKAIAGRLRISESTVNWHLANALRKLGASSRAAAVASAMRDGALGKAPPLPHAPSARELRRWQVMLAAVMTLMLATPLVIAAAFLTALDRAGEPIRTGEPTRSPPVSSAPSALASSTMIPARSNAPTPPPPPTAEPAPRSGPVGSPSVATVAPVAPIAPIATPTAGPVAPLATPALPSPLTTPALPTPALPSPLKSPAPATAVPSVPVPTLLPSVPELPSVP